MADGSFETYVAQPGEYSYLYEYQPSSYRSGSAKIRVPSREPVEGLTLKAE